MLRRQTAHHHAFTIHPSAAYHPAPAELAAEKEVLRRQAAVAAAPADDLRRLQERLAA